MQKGEQKKLQLMLTGVKARAEQNRDYFVSMEFTFRSGGKKFKAELRPDGDGYKMTFQGTARKIGIAEALEFFGQQTALYEESVLTYTERGMTMTVTADKKGVKMRQSEQKIPEETRQTAANPLLDSGRQYWIQVDKAAPLLREIGILTAGGKLKNDMIRKYN